MSTLKRNHFLNCNESSSHHQCLGGSVKLQECKVVDGGGCSYRQLAAHIQREFPLLRPYISIAWTVVNKWEHFEPVQHRTPMPEPLLRAMCSVALLWKWKRVAAILLLTFYNINRIGEVLRAAWMTIWVPMLTSYFIRMVEAAK